MKLSFKFKIALISFGVSGALLTVFGIALFAFIYSTGLDRMDRELRVLVEAPLRGGHPLHYWRDFGNSIKFIHGESGGARIAIMALGPANDILFRSETASLQMASLPLPDPLGQRRGEERPPTRTFLDRHDFDGDQKVSTNEFPGPSRAFSRNDVDGNGYIEGTELENMPISPRRMDGGAGPPGPRGQGPAAPPPNVSRFQMLEMNNTVWRVGIFRSPDTTIFVAMDMKQLHAEADRIRNAFMVSVPLGLIVLGLLGWFLADRAMKPVAVIADTAEGITAKGLDKRIPNVGNDVELERLATVSNNMLDRLEKSYHQAVRFSADAAHELQTPLTILQGELDNAIQDAEDGSEEQQRYSMLLEELRNLKSVVQKLLLLAHADEGRLNLNPADTDLSELVANTAEDIEIMAPELDIEARIEQGVHVSADATLINQAIRNMTSNAAKYASANGRVCFTLGKKHGKVRFTLANTAAPIPDADRALLFERFHRVEKARSTSGSGLGLSLAREIARAHHGDLVLDPNEDGMVSFTLTLPTD